MCKVGKNILLLGIDFLFLDFLTDDEPGNDHAQPVNVTRWCRVMVWGRIGSHGADPPLPGINQALEAVYPKIGYDSSLFQKAVFREVLRALNSLPFCKIE